MRTDKVISVIVPVYNAKSTLRRCVDSILNQDYYKLQVILVDDGSNDGSSAICDEYALKDNRVCVVHQENGGVCKARNTGLDISSGDYIAFVDNDDYIMQGMYSRMVAEVENNNLDICICHHLSGSVESEVPFVPDEPKLKEGIYDSYEAERLLFSKNWYQSGIICAIWNKLYKREAVEGVRFSGLWGEDYEYNDTINSKHLLIGIIEDAYYVWCSNPKSQSHQAYSPHWSSFLMVIKKRAVLFSDDKDISIKSKKLFCDLYIEYRIISMLNHYIFPDSYDLIFKRYVSDLLGNNECSIKWHLRMKVFQLSPQLYYRMTKKRWQNMIKS